MPSIPRLTGGHFAALGSALLCALVPLGAQASADERSATRPAPRPPAATPSTPRQNPSEPTLALEPLKAALPTDEIPLLGADVGFILTPSSPEAFGGQRTGKEATLSDRVASYAIKATFDPTKHTVDGRETLTWRNRSNVPVRTLYLHTYLNAFQGQSSTFMTEKARYGQFRSGVEIEKGEWGYIDILSIEQNKKGTSFRYVQPDGGPVTDRTVLRVDLAEPIAPGATGVLDIAFHDQLPRVMARTGYFDKFHLVGQWFPKVGVLELAGERGASGPRWNCHEMHLNTEFYADWGSYDLEVTAPKGWTVAASGVRVGTATDTAQGTVHTFKADDIHDLVFTAWDGFAPPISGTYDGPGSPHVTVEVYFPPEYESSGKAALQATLDSLRYFSANLGPYPYPHLTVVIPPFNAREAGGMEYETFFTTESSKADVLVRYVTIHEFGHGYFMGLLASSEPEEPMLDEGLNEFWGTRMMKADPGPPEQWTWEKRLGFKFPAIEPFDIERSMGLQRNYPDALAQASWDLYSQRSWGTIYSRTTTAVHDLEAELGTPLFEKAFKLYYARWKFRHPSVADFKQAFLDAGAPAAVMDRAFAMNVHGTEIVDDVITDLDSKELVPKTGTAIEDGKRVELDDDAVQKLIKEKREAWKKEHAADSKGVDVKKGAPGPYPFRSVVKAWRHGAQVPQTLQLTFEDGSVETIKWPIGERWHLWELVRPSKLESALLDPDHTILLDQNKFDDGRVREPNQTAARRWALEVGAVLEALFALGGSL